LDKTPNHPAETSFYSQSLGREMLNTSGRWAMWKVSLRDIRHHPVLGVGPMNFACKGPLNEAGHPHNFPLQIAGEWGLPAALTVFLLLTSLILGAFKRLRTTQFESEAQQLLTVLLAGGILTAAVHACLSGVMVMPASQLAGMLICGWFVGLLSLKPDSTGILEPRSNSQISFGAGLLAVFVAFSLLMLLFSVHETTLRDENMNQTRIGDVLIPRYWQNGKMCGI